MDLHGTKQVIGLAVTMGARQGRDKVVPGAICRLLHVPSRSGAYGGHRLGEEFELRDVRFTGRRGCGREVMHRLFRRKGPKCG